jgi:hypothetical protein
MLFGEGVGASSRDGVHPLRRKGRDVERNPAADAPSEEIGPIDPGIVEHCDDVPDEIDRPVGGGVMRLAAVAVSAQINQDDPSGTDQARLNEPELAPKFSSFAKSVQHHDWRFCTDHVVGNSYRSC